MKLFPSSVIDLQDSVRFPCGPNESPHSAQLKERSALERTNPRWQLRCSDFDSAVSVLPSKQSVNRLIDMLSIGLAPNNRLASTRCLSVSLGNRATSRMLIADTVSIANGTTYLYGP